MMTRELIVTGHILHPFPCDRDPLVIIASVIESPGVWRISATVNCPCGLATVEDAHIVEKRRQVKKS